MKKYFFALLLIVFITPSVVFASWWNPISWKVFKKKEIVPQVQVEKQKTPEEKISDLQKQLDDLKKQQPIPTSNTTYPIIKKEVKKNIPAVDELASLKAQNQAKLEAEAKIRAEQHALSKAQILAQQEIEIRQQAQEQANQKAAAFQQELEQKQALLTEMKANCDNPINQVKTEILQLKSDYYVKYKAIGDNCRGCTTAGVQGQYDGLLRVTNQKIDELNLKIQQIALQCSIKYGN